jgi:hypothetical protein
MNNSKHDLIAYWATIILILLLIIEMFNGLDYSGVWGNNSFYELSNSDSLALNAYCRDIIGNIGNMLSWNLGTALWFFPNTLLMVLIELFIHQTLIVQLAYGILQVFLIVFLSNYLMKIIYPQISKLCLSISNLCLSLFFVYSVAYHDFMDFTSNLIVPYHTGALINVFICLIFLFRYLITKKKIHLYLFAISSIFANISDGLICIYLCGPLLVALFVVMKWYKSDHHKEISKLFWFNLITFIGGYFLGKLMQHIFNISFNGLGFISKSNIIISYNVMMSQFKIYFTSGGVQSMIMYLALISLIFSSVFSIMLLKRKQENRTSFDYLFLIYFLFSFFFITITFIAPVILGVYGGYYSIRYNIVLLYFALLNIGFILAYLAYYSIIKKPYIKISFFLLFASYGTFSMITAIKENPINVFSKINSYYPTFIKATDEFSKTYNCKYGVGNLWDARYITSLSKQHVVVNTVFDNLVPWQMVNNKNRYYWTNDAKNEQVIYNFIVLRSISDTTTIHKIFGTENIKKVTADGFSYYIVPEFFYDKNENNAVKIISFKSN